MVSSMMFGQALVVEWLNQAAQHIHLLTCLFFNSTHLLARSNEQSLVLLKSLPTELVLESVA